jgi:serine/threonine protein kinase/tetratricopeptide (TPR) repeat protein
LIFHEKNKMIVTMNDQPSRDEELFTRALGLPVGQRSAFLDQACGDDTSLLQRVKTLLKMHDRAGEFLEQSAQRIAVRTRAEIQVGEKPSDRIGTYKLLQQIGEGGGGIVFMAEQEDFAHRKVALKIIKPGMDTKSVIARFEAERRALTLMDHPSIAKVFDAGATESGRPYFVMELIRGIKITKYCDENSLTTEERLGLFVQVCQAIQHAHQKGIIHRDIKPSNILVTEQAGGRLLPVVIDFGIAKATSDQRLTEATLFTSFEMVVGTPAYMSPEQASLASVEVDTRTDIYSLGILLYELLTGSTPFNTAELLKTGLDEIRRVIREQEPLRPSVRLSSLAPAELVAVAKYRRTDSVRLIRAVRGDLDWIVVKALEKDRTRRYETVNGLALDVKRFLNNETVLARPPSRLYKFQKTVERNKLVFAGAGIVTTLLVTSLIVVSILLARERQVRREADSDKLEAQQVTRFLETTLQGVGPSVALGRDTTMLREMLDKTADRLGDMTNQPAVEAELCDVIGNLYGEVGNYRRAEDMLGTAVAIRRKVSGPESAETATSLNNLGLAYMNENKLPEAEQAHDEAYKIRLTIFGSENAETAASLNDLSSVYRQEGKLIEAESMARSALAVRQKLSTGDSLEVADSLRNLCIILGDEGKWEDSEEAARRVLKMRSNLLGPVHPLVAAAMDDLAWACGARGKLEEAEKLEQEALSMRLKLLPENHPDVALSLYLIGDRMRQMNDMQSADSVLSAAYSIQRKVLGAEDPDLFYTLRSLGLALESEGKLPEAEQVDRQALDIYRKQGDMENPQALSEVDNLVRVLKSEKKFNEAEYLLDQILTPELIAKTSSQRLLYLRADLRAHSGQWQEAAADAMLAFEDQPTDRGLYAMSAALLLEAKEQSKYEQFCNTLLTQFGDTTNIYVADQIAKSCLFVPVTRTNSEVVYHLADLPVTQGPEDQYAMPYFEVCKALSEYRQGHYDKAVEWAQQPLKIDGNESHGHAYAILAMANWRLGKKAEAQTMLAKGNDLAPRSMPAEVAEDPGDRWEHWLFARIQMDEATALILQQEPVTNN